MIDNGYKRAAADMIGRSSREVEVARLIVTIFSKVSPTPTLLLPICERIEPHHTALVRFCNTRTRVWSSAPVRTAAVLTMMNHGDEDYVQLVYRALVTNDLNDMPKSARALISAQLRGQIKASNTYDLFCRCLKVFDATKESVTRVQINDPSAMIARLRPFVYSEIFGNGANKKKAATHATARKPMPGDDHTPNLAHVY
uniref:hypothetical protein n=1 Tax=Burkholderia diffusa TaxID=488732 RepID=UPI001CC5D4F8|nr:hypothetical protein [Burkholderia diffusa]